VRINDEIAKNNGLQIKSEIANKIGKTAIKIRESQINLVRLKLNSKERQIISKITYIL
jgi:hypothetical protein